MNAGYVEHLKKLGYEASVPMRGKIEEWHGWYTASNAWYVSEERSAADRRTYRVDRLSIKPARMVCQEWAGLLMNERTAVACDDEACNAWLDRHLESSRFFSVAQRLVERTFALGTGAWALPVGTAPRAHHRRSDRAQAIQ